LTLVPAGLEDPNGFGAPRLAKAPPPILAGPAFAIVVFFSGVLAPPPSPNMILTSSL